MAKSGNEQNKQRPALRLVVLTCDFASAITAGLLGSTARIHVELSPED